MRPARFVAAVAALALCLPAGAWASGFSIFEQSAKASGLGGAWVAAADDAAANWYNPAALVWMDGNEIQFGTNFIAVGSDTKLTSSDQAFGLFAPTTFETESSIETPSSIYYAQRAGDRFAWGIGVNNPYGLVTEWRDRPVTFTAGRAELTTFVINPNFAFQIADEWSLAVGLDYILADVGEFSREVPIDLDMNPLNGFEIIGASNLTGNGNDLGFNLALHRRSGTTTFGLTYRSALSPKIDGDIDFSGFGPLSGFFQDSPGSTTLNLPDQAAIGFGWMAGSWSFEGDVAYAGWSEFQELAIDITNNVPGFVDDVVLEERWDDTFSYRFGASWHGSGPHEWRFGGVFDESPVPSDTLRPSIPDGDRTGISVGYGYHGTHWHVDAYYMPLWFANVTAVSGEDGVIAGKYESSTQLAGLSFGRHF